MSWNARGTVRQESAETLLHDQTEDDEGFSYVLIRSVLEQREQRVDPHWMDFHARWETTQSPADYLWGPGSRREAASWLQQEQPEGDMVEILDRVFLIAVDGGQVHAPMRLQVAADLPPDEQSGTWYTVRADFPVDAFGHVRGRVEHAGGHARDGVCRVCSAHELGRALTSRHSLPPKRTLAG